MRAPRILAAFVFIVALIVAIFTVPYYLANSSYLGFKHKNAKYHADFAEACSSILAQHPLGTNKVIALSVTDPSLPTIISDLHPLRIELSPNYVWILVHGGHIGGLAIVWKPQWEPQDQTQTNTWTLCINSGEGPEESVYVASRK
jgi:hypothetical protein